MSRVHKYRAWDKRENKMRTDYLGKSGDDKNDWILFFEPEIIEGTILEGIRNPFPRERFELMEFTGLLDKNNVEIYEGDIVTGDKPYYVTKVTGVVEYRGMGFAFIGKTEDGKYWFDTSNKDVAKRLDIEVIGNRFGNPEYLEE